MRPFRQATIVIATLALTVRAGAAQSVSQFWPELDYFQQLSGQSRILAQALAAYGPDSVGEYAQFGINYDFSIKRRFIGDGDVGAQSLAEDRRQWLQVRLGYRYAENIGQSGPSYQNRLIVELTLRRTVWGIVGADRNGFDFRWTDGVYSTRYRNRLYLERPVRAGHYAFTPFGDVEFAYTLSSGRWSYAKWELGAQLPVARHLTAEVYGALQNGWTSQPSQINALGVTLVVSY